MLHLFTAPSQHHQAQQYPKKSDSKKSQYQYTAGSLPIKLKSKLKTKLKNRQATPQRPTRHKAGCVLAFGCIGFITCLQSTAFANMTDGEHHAQPVDLSEPIEAMSRLTSLQDTAPLEYDLPEFERFVTDNGVPVIFFATNQLPIVDVSIRFDAGGARDTAIRSDAQGLAHLTAAMLTAQTQHKDETQMALTIEKLGIELGSAAFKDQFLVSLRSLSDPAILHDATAFMNEVLTAPKFDDAVLNRHKATQLLGLKQLTQSPAYIADSAFNQALYGKHPYANSPYGTLDSVPSITPEDIHDFWARYLVASNASISITGDLSTAQAKHVANRIVAQMRIGSPAPALPDIEPNINAHTQSEKTSDKKSDKTAGKPTPIHIDYDSDQTHVIIGKLGYKVSADPEILAQQTAFAIGNEVLAGSGFNSRLMQKVRKEQGYTYGIYGSMTTMQAPGPYQISFSTRNERAKEAIDSTLAVIEDTQKNGISQQEFALTKDSMINSYPMAFASNAGINNMLGSLLFYDLPSSFMTQYATRVQNITLEEVNHALSEQLDTKDFLIVTIGDPDFAKASTKDILEEHFGNTHSLFADESQNDVDNH